MIPEEILYAASIVSVRIVHKREDKSEYSRYLPTNFSALAKIHLDYVLTNGNKIDGVIVTPSCTAAEFVFDAIGQQNKPAFNFMLDLPRKIEASAEDYYASELERLARSIEKCFEVVITEEKLTKAIDHFNQIRKIILKLKQYQKDGLISGQRYFDLMNMIGSTKKDMVMKNLNDEIAEIGRSDLVMRGIKKILCLGSPPQSACLLCALESVGLHVILDDYCTSGAYLGKPVSTTGNIYKNLAHSYLGSHMCSRTNAKPERVQYIKKLISKYNPDGIVYNLSQFRIPDCYDLVMLKEEIMSLKEPLPFLAVIDNGNDVLASAVQTSIDAFAEMLICQ